MSSKADKTMRRMNKLSKTEVKLGTTFTGWHHSIKSTFPVDLNDSPHVSTSLRSFSM